MESYNIKMVLAEHGPYPDRHSYHVDLFMQGNGWLGAGQQMMQRRRAENPGIDVGLEPALHLVEELRRANMDLLTAFLCASMRSPEARKPISRN